MPINGLDVLDSPGWWLKRLHTKLTGRQERLGDLIARFEGNGPLPHVSESVADAYRAFQRKSRTNWAELVVEAPRERMVVNGFQTAAAAGESGDDLALQVWEANGLGVESADVFQMMLAAGDGYMIVGGPAEGDTIPIITGEDPRQVVTIHDPAQQRRVLGALKMFHDADQARDVAYLYLPGRRFVARGPERKTVSNGNVYFIPSRWEWDDDKGGADGEEMPHNIVPVVRFRNRRGVGEFELHRDLLDRIDHMVLQRLVIATLQAFRQRAVKNLPEEDESGEEIDWSNVFVADPGALWQIPEGVEFWESAATDLTPLLTAVKDDLRALAAVTRTALSHLTPDQAAGSAEGASLMRESEIFRTLDRMARAGEALKDVMLLAFLTMKDEQRANRALIRPMWASPERLSLAEKGDAASKATDMSRRQRLIRIWDLPPGEVDAMESEIAAEQLTAAVNGQQPLAIEAVTGA